MFSTFSREEPDNVRASTPSLPKAIGLLFAGLLPIGMSLVAFPTWNQILSGDLPFSWDLLLSEEILMIAVAIGLGAAFWWLAYKEFRLWRTYGTSYLRLATAPVPLGESLRARFLAPISADEQPSNGFQVRVACIHKDKDGDNERVVGEESVSVTGQPGPGGTVVPLTLNLSTHRLLDTLKQEAQMVSELGGPDLLDILDWEDLDWTLEVTASFDDKPDYKASFDLPILVPDDLDVRADDASTTKGLISSNESAEPEADTASPDASDEVYWSMDNDRAETNLSRSPSENESGADEKKTFSEPVSRGIHMNGDPSAGLTFSFDHDRPSMHSRGYQLAGFGTITLFFGLGLFLFLGGMGALIGILLVLVGGVALHSSWKAFTYDTRIRVANGQIEVQKGAFFLDPTLTQISCDALADVKVLEADYDVPADVKVWGGDDRYIVLKKQGTAGFIPVAPGLGNEDEAQWIADRIREAARQQASAS